MSRIYLLHPDGLVLTHFEYVNYFMADLEVVDNQVYVAEAFAPRVLKVDLQTGEPPTDPPPAPSGLRILP